MRSDRTDKEGGGRANPILREIQIFIISIFPTRVLERKLKENRITERWNVSPLGGLAQPRGLRPHKFRLLTRSVCCRLYLRA